MRLPVAQLDLRPWPEGAIAGWVELGKRAEQLEQAAGGGNAFDEMVERIRRMTHQMKFQALRPLLRKRLTARALSWLWLHDDDVGPLLIKTQLLDNLVEAQTPRLTRITLLQLLQLYFKRFDLLDARVGNGQRSFRQALEEHLQAQLGLIPKPTIESRRPDPLLQMRRQKQWLLGPDGPHTLARRVREQDSELRTAFSELGLGGFDAGRYADICRAHFYLDTLRAIEPGAWHDVLDQLADPSVHGAPYEDRRIGHAALEIMIDRSSDAPSTDWQAFILDVAGDPRIAAKAKNFVEWWKPLGPERIEKVRGWLAKEDLRLFLQAVEQYGKQERNADLQRMFPARKVFLEGLYKLGLVRNTRLMLGHVAREAVERILETSMRTQYADLTVEMSDKAVIYLDCGAFHFVEGSHSFKIWTYLAKPHPWVTSYERTRFSLQDLIKVFPRKYEEDHAPKDHLAVVHIGAWQKRVFEFLADNGITLDIEQLLTKKDYRNYLQQHGVPIARRTSTKAVMPRASQPSPSQRKRDPGARKSLPAGAASISELTAFERKLLRFFLDNPGSRAKAVALEFIMATPEINQLLYGRLKAFVRKTQDNGWVLKDDAARSLKHLG